MSQAYNDESSAHCGMNHARMLTGRRGDRSRWEMFCLENDRECVVARRGWPGVTRTDRAGRVCTSSRRATLFHVPSELWVIGHQGMASMQSIPRPVSVAADVTTYWHKADIMWRTGTSICLRRRLRGRRVLLHSSAMRWMDRWMDSTRSANNNPLTVLQRDKTRCLTRENYLAKHVLDRHDLSQIIGA